MAYDEALAERVRELVESLDAETREQKMFGGIAWMLRGNLLVGIIGDELMVRLDPDLGRRKLAEQYTRPFDMTGRAMNGFILVAPEGCRGAALRRWFDIAHGFVDAMPPKRK